MTDVRGAKVLVLDDDPDLVQAIAEVLCEAGFAVEKRVSRNIDDVLDLAPELVLVDCPPGAAREILNFIQRLRLNKRTAAIPLIIGSSSTKDFEAEPLRAQMIHVLLRPFEIDDLVQSVTDLVAAGRSARSASGDRTKRNAREQAG